MADEEKKIIVDDDWKAEAQREKERLNEETAQPEALPDAAFPELVNIVAMQAMAAMGLLGGPSGERMPANLPVAKHFIDLLQVLEDKTKTNLTDEEQKLLSQVLYEIRMQYVQMAQAGGAGPAAPNPPQT